MWSSSQSAPAFQPSTTYDPDGDCLEFLVKPDPFYGERIDELVTVYDSQETKEIIGSLIKGVTGFGRRLSERMPGFKIEIQDGPIKLEHFFFLVKMWGARPTAPASERMSVATLTYRRVSDKLIEAAEQSDARASWRASEGGRFSDFPRKLKSGFQVFVSCPSISISQYQFSSVWPGFGATNKGAIIIFPTAAGEGTGVTLSLLARWTFANPLISH